MRCCILFLFLLTYNTQLVFANCTCQDSISIHEAKEQADYVFAGEVIQLDSDWISGGWKFTFKVATSWKKPIERLQVIHTAWEKDCGYIFEEGRMYVVFVQKKFTPKTFKCMGNRPILTLNEGIKLLGKGMPPQPSPARISMYWIIGILAAMIMLGMLFIVLRKKNHT